MIIRFDGTEIGGNYIAGVVKNAKVYDGVFKLGSTICETYKLSINKDGISSIPQVVTISTNEYTLSGGNHLYIEGATTDDLVDYSVDGATEQTTYTGKNKLGLVDGVYTNNSVTATVKDGVITLTGTNSSTSTTFITISRISTLQNSTEYIFSSGVTSGMGSSSIQLRCFLGDSSTQTTFGNTETTNTTLSTGDNFNFMIRIAGSYNTNGKVLKPMIRLSSIADNTWEQYVGGIPSPNSDYPQEIKTIPSIINIYDPNFRNSSNKIYCSNGTATEENGEFSLTATGTDLRIWSVQSTGASYDEISMGKLYEFEEDTYTVMITNPLFTKNFVTYYDENKVSLSYLTKSGSTFTINKTDKNGAKYFAVRIGYGSAVSGNTYKFSVMLEKGSISHQYVPYGYWSKVKVTGKNMYNKSLEPKAKSNTTTTSLETGVRVASNIAGTYHWTCIPLFDISNYAGKKMTLYSDMTPSASNSPRINILTCDANGGNRTTIDNITSSGSKTITIPSVTSPSTYIGLMFYSNTSGTANVGDYVDYTNIQLELGETATTYEPYKENITLIDMSKPSIFDITQTPFTSRVAYNSSGVQQDWNGYSGTTNFTNVNSSTTYSINTNSNPYTIFIVEYNDSQTFIQRTSLSKYGRTFTTTANTKYIKISISDETVPTTFEMYVSNNNTPYYELCKIGDYKDVLSVDSSGNVSIDKKIGKVVLNGSESGWNSTGGNAYVTIEGSIKNTALSNYFIYSSSASTYGEIKWSNSQPWLIFYGTTTQHGSLANFKTWLSTHNTNVYYVLATSETITLPNANIPLFDGINHITFVDDLDTTTTIVHKTPIKTLYTTDYDDKNDFTYEIQTEDAMTKFNFKYDASPIMTHTKTVGEETINYAYLSEILADICTKAGVTNGISSFYQDDMEVSWYDNTLLARDYLGFIGEINGKNLCISPRNELVFKVIKTTPTKTIDLEDTSDFKIGAEHTITRVVWDNGINKWEYGNETGETYYINTSNVYVIDTSIVEHIYNEINGLDYYNFKSKNYPLDGLKVGDIVRFTDGTNNYDTFTQFDNATFSKDSWFGGIELNVDSERKQETQVIGQEDKIRTIKQTVDRTNNTVSTLVEETGEISTAVETLQTNTYTKTQVQRIVDGTGVDGVKVTKVETISGTFDIDGMHYAKSGAETESTINQYGVEVERTEDEEQLLFAGYDTTLKKAIVTSEHLITRRYLSIGENSRLQDYKTGGGVWVI